MGKADLGLLNKFTHVRVFRVLNPVTLLQFIMPRNSRFKIHVFIIHSWLYALQRFWERVRLRVNDNNNMRYPVARRSTRVATRNIVRSCASGGWHCGAGGMQSMIVTCNHLRPNVEGARSTRQSPSRLQSHLRTLLSRCYCIC